MNRFFSWIQSIQLRQVLTTVLLGLMFLVGTVFSSYVPEASAKSLTPEANSYKVDQQTGGYYRLNETRSARPEDKTQQAGSGRIEEKVKLNSQASDSNTGKRRNNEGLAQDQSYVKRNGNYAKDNGRDTFDATRENPKGNVRDVTDGVREKLNLDQPVYPGTKKFINDVQERADNVLGNSKDAIGGVGRDIKNTVDNSFERVD